MIISVHAGHNPDGKIACCACGIMKESTSAREITTKLYKIRVDSIMNRDTADSAIKKLKAIGINCTIEEV